MNRVSAAPTSSDANPVFSICPVVLPAPGRALDLHIRVSAPVVGRDLPVLLLSHGHGPSHHLSSLHGYAPLAQRLAAAGFVVLQPTHLDSAMLPFRKSDHPDAPLFWQSRVQDMVRILDQLDVIERAVPAITGRIHREKIAVLGHSMGGHTASVLLGARHGALGERPIRFEEPRIRAGVLLAAPGRGDALSEYAAQHYPFFTTIDFSTMTTPALVVVGDHDGSRHLTTAGASWHADPYTLAPGPKSLVTLFGAGHGLGGVSGYDAAETTDASPERVAAIAMLCGAYLRSRFDPGDGAWDEAQVWFQGEGAALGRVESKAGTVL